MAKGVGLRRLSRRGSWVQIPPPALFNEPARGVTFQKSPLRHFSRASLCFLKNPMKGSGSSNIEFLIKKFFSDHPGYC